MHVYKYNNNTYCIYEYNIPVANKIKLAYIYARPRVVT